MAPSLVGPDGGAAAPSCTSLQAVAATVKAACGGGVGDLASCVQYCGLALNMSSSVFLRKVDPELMAVLVERARRAAMVCPYVTVAG